MTIAHTMADTIQVWVSDSTDDPLDSGSTSRVEIYGCKSVKKTGGKKETILIRGFASTEDKRSVLVSKPADKITLELDFDAADLSAFDKYFRDTSGTEESAQSSECAVGIQATKVAADGTTSTQKITLKPARVEDITFDAAIGDAMKSKVVISCRPVDFKIE